MKDYNGVFSLGFIIDFVERFSLSYLFKSKSFKSQCFSLRKKIPYSIYETVIFLDNIPLNDLIEFEEYYKSYLLEYDRFLYRKKKGYI